MRKSNIAASSSKKRIDELEHVRVYFFFIFIRLIQWHRQRRCYTWHNVHGEYSHCSFLCQRIVHRNTGKKSLVMSFSNSMALHVSRFISFFCCLDLSSKFSKTNFSKFVQQHFCFSGIHFSLVSILSFFIRSLLTRYYLSAPPHSQTIAIATSNAGQYFSIHYCLRLCFLFALSVPRTQTCHSMEHFFLLLLLLIRTINSGEKKND